MKFRRNLLSRQFRNSDPDADAGGGGFTETPAAPAETVDTGTTAVAEAPAFSSDKMLETMFGQKPAPVTEAEQAEAAAAGKTVQQLRDERGRFAGKAPTDQQGKPAADPTKPAVKPDPNAMPEGLTPKAQERFQALANTNKELTARVTEWEPIVSSARELQQTFQQNGVKREQFDQAMQVVGLMNRGDLRGALSALDEQRRLISLHLGVVVPGTDPLEGHPDLRQDVDNLLMTEARAMEIARFRMNQQQGQQQQQRQQAEQRQQQESQQREQQQQQAVQQGQLAVDKFCKDRMASDLDYQRIEPMLLKEIQGGLLEGVPPQRWAALVEKTYGLIKQTAGMTRASGATTTVLRPTGGGTPNQQPQNAYEAMWGKSKPAGA